MKKFNLQNIERSFSWKSYFRRKSDFPILNVLGMLFLVIFLFTSTNFVLAQGSIFNDVDPLKGQGIESVVNNILSFMRTLGVSLVTIFIIYGGITWMTSGGNQKKIEEGRDTLKWSVIGLAVILMASGIASAVLETLKVKDNPLEAGQQNNNKIDRGTGRRPTLP